MLQERELPKDRQANRGNDREKRRSKCNSQAQTNRTPAVYALLRERLKQATEVGVVVNLCGNDLQSVRINSNREIPEKSKWPSATTVITIRGPQRMVENIVHIGANTRNDALPKVQILVQAKIYAPSARTVQEIALGNFGIVKNIRAHRRERE